MNSARLIPSWRASFSINSLIESSTLVETAISPKLSDIDCYYIDFSLLKLQGKLGLPLVNSVYGLFSYHRWMHPQNSGLPKG